MSVQAQAPVAAPLHFNNRRDLPLHRLPFIGPVRGRTQFSFWAVPRTGGYAGGNEVGRGLARIYLKYLKQYGRPEGLGALQWIVLDMIGPAAASALTPEQSALRGQVVGFFSELDAWLEVAVCDLEGGLDAQSDKALLALVNAGLRSEGRGEEGKS
tara:strand:- start:323 stop:790 length:468 start_codon:yes stop_codon:yes gene_type:complete